MMPANFTGYLMGIVQSLFTTLDAFMQKFMDSVVFSSAGGGIGGGAFGLFGGLVGMIGFFLCAAIIWNIGEGVLHWSKSGETPWTNIRKVFLGGLLATIAIGAQQTYLGSKTTSGLKNATYMGISYSGMTSGLSQQALTPALSAIATVDIPEAWAINVMQYDDVRRDKILAAIAAKDPEAAKTYLNRINYTAGKASLDGTKDSGTARTMLSTASLVAATMKDIYSGGLTQSAIRLIVNGVISSCILIGVMLCEVVFACFAARTILVLAFYLKLASLLSLLVLPASLILLYFESLRDFGIRAIRQVIVLLVVANALAACTQAVFNQTTIKAALAESIRDVVGPVDSPVTQEDILGFETLVDENAVGTLMGGLSPSDAKEMSDKVEENTMNYLLFQGMSITDFFHAALCAIKMMMMMGAMLLVLSKFYEVIGNVFEGDFDPLREGKKAAG